jgi:O-methyltransferase involved in polyketide biosynthesis
MVQKIKITLGSVQETLLLPLWGRAIEAQKNNPLLNDPVSVEIINRLDYDFATIAKNISFISQYAWVARSIHIDRLILQFLNDHPNGTIINLGCGLDTTLERIDNGTLHYYDLDLPDVIDLRNKLVPHNERRNTIASSFLDDKWFNEITIEDNLLIIAAGVFYYFEQNQIKDFFIRIGDHFTNADIFFDSASQSGVRVANKKVIKNGGMDENALLKWGLDHPEVIKSWDKRIHLLSEFPIFKGIKKGLSGKIKFGLFFSDILNIMSMIHLRISS